MASFVQPPPQNFATKILWLIHRYIIDKPKKKRKKSNPSNNHQTFHTSTLNKLIKAYQITQSYYSSSLTCPTTLTQYNLPHNPYMIFGTSGLTKSSKWMGVGVAHPPYHKSTIEIIYWARMDTKEDPSTTIIIICNHQTPKILETYKDMHPILTIPPNTWEYTYELQFPYSQTSTNGCLTRKSNIYSQTTYGKPEAYMMHKWHETFKNLQYTQYIRNHQTNTFLPLTYLNPSCTLCPNLKIDTWPHLIFTYTHTNL